MTRMFHRLAIVLCGSLLPILVSGAQQQRFGRILGVFDDATGNPIAGAEVIDLASNTKALTSESGVVTLGFLRRGTTLIQIRKVGYASRMVPVVVSDADTTSITVVLKPLAQTLPKVVTSADAPVTGKLSEFEDRKHVGIGRFITQAELDKNANRQLSEVMQSIAGTRIIRAKSTSTAWAASSRGNQSVARNCPRLDKYDMARGATCLCYAAVVLDGAVVYGGHDGEPLFDLK